MSLPHSYEDMVRRHDQAFFNWLGGLHVDYGTPATLDPNFPVSGVWPTRLNFPILRVMASPSRAFAPLVNLLVSQGWISGADAATLANDIAVLPLPVATIERGDPEIDPTSTSVPKAFRRSRFNQETQLWESHRWPGVYYTPYRVTFWCAKRYTEAFLREWIMSQLGRLGVADSEVLIQVDHRDPWNKQWQNLRFEGLSDLSDLEGDAQRMLRFEASFRLRTLHMRPDVATSDYLNAVQAPQTFLQSGDGSDTDAFDRDADLSNAPSISDNLFTPYYTTAQDIAAKWPRTGGATVRRSPIAPADGKVEDTLELSVRAVTDGVGIVNKPVFLTAASPDNYALLSVAMRYRATAEVSLRIEERTGVTPAVWTPVRSVVLAERTAWTDFQFFTLLDQPIFGLDLLGQAIASTVHLTDVSVRHVYAQPRISATGSSLGYNGGTLFTWNGLPTHQSYLLVVVPSAFSGTWSVRIEDDESSPNNVITRLFNAAAERGLVELIQPKASSIGVTLPSGFTAADLYLQPYYAGTRARLQ